MGFSLHRPNIGGLVQAFLAVQDVSCLKMRSRQYGNSSGTSRRTDLTVAPRRQADCWESLSYPRRLNPVARNCPAQIEQTGGGTGYQGEGSRSRGGCHPQRGVEPEPQRKHDKQVVAARVQLP